MKKYFYIILWLFFSLKYDLSIGEKPNIVCDWIPWCESVDFSWVEINSDNEWFFNFLDTTVATMIKYVAVIAVIALIISGIYYLISMWEDEKVNKAKKMIIWSLVGVIVSTSRVFLINMVTKFNIN